jgi:hypothetical protein
VECGIVVLKKQRSLEFAQQVGSLDRTSNAAHTIHVYNSKVNVKQLLYRPELALRFPEG